MSFQIRKKLSTVWLSSPQQTCASWPSTRVCVCNEFQWHLRLVLSEEQAESLPRPGDKQTHPPNCNTSGREGCSLVGRCSLSDLSCFAPCLPSFLCFSSLSVSLSTPIDGTPLLCSTSSPFLSPSFPSHLPPLCSGSRISSLCTAGVCTSVLLAASYVAH